MTLCPSEYEGEHGTCVFGRVVLKRGPFVPTQASQDTDTQASQGGKKGKGKAKKGKGKQAEEGAVKLEIHLLGGNSVDEVLFMDAWGDGARELSQTVEHGKVYRISGAKKIDTTHATRRRVCLIFCGSCILLV